MESCAEDALDLALSAALQATDINVSTGLLHMVISVKAGDMRVACIALFRADSPLRIRTPGLAASTAAMKL